MPLTLVQLPHYSTTSSFLSLPSTPLQLSQNALCLTLRRGSSPRLHRLCCRHSPESAARPPEPSQAASLVSCIVLQLSSRDGREPERNGTQADLRFRICSRGRRALDDTLSSAAAAAPTALPSEVPDVVTGSAVTISNTQAAAPGATAAAVGVDRGDTAPLAACPPSASFGSYCDPASSVCW